LGHLSYAIDFGTSNTVVARWNPVTQQAETLSLPGVSLRMGQNPDLIPSLLYVEEAQKAQVLVGQQVRDRGLDIQSDPRFFRGFKRGIGTSVQGFLPELDGQQVRFEDAGCWFLTSLVNQLKTSYPDAGDALVLTVPVDSFEPYRQWLGQICQTLQVQQVRMLDEPTAAALGYGKSEADVILVMDFGGGTLDLSLVQIDRGRAAQAKPMGFILKWGEKNMAEATTQRPKMARVLAKAGQNLGGTDLDHWLVDYFSKTQALPVTPLTLRLAERLKIQLSLQSKGSEVYFNEETFDSYELALERFEFEKILKDHQFFERLDNSMTQVLQQARRQGITVENIDAVLLVGGTSLIPCVQNWVQQYFDPSKISSSRPFEAIAQGALQILQGVEVKDFLYHSYGIRYWDRRANAHNWHTLIQTGQPYPMTDPVELVLGASNDGQPSIELIVGELGQETGGTEIYFDGDRLITRSLSASQAQVQALNDRDGARSIAKLDPPGFPGSDRIKVLFQVDSGRALRITVEDLLTQETLVTDRVVAQLN
jgi:molecular chaperone DnaK (HSP70)